MTEASNHPPNLNGLVELGQREGVDIRPTLLRVMTDLYVQKPVHSAEEERQFTELALRLIDLVDAATRAAVADKIAAYSSAPAAVRRRMLRETITVVPPNEGRADGGAPFDGAPVADAELSALFFAATPDERRMILINLPLTPLQAAPALPSHAAAESIRKLESAALAHNGDAFIRELQRVLSISPQLAQRLARDETGEPIVVAAVALGMPAAVLQRILLCLSPAISRSVQRVYDLALLHEEIEREAALRLVAIWQASDRAEKPAVSRPDAHRAPGRPHDPDRRAMPSDRPKIRWDEYAGARRAGDAS